VGALNNRFGAGAGRGERMFFADQSDAIATLEQDTLVRWNAAACLTSFDPLFGCTGVEPSCL